MSAFPLALLDEIITCPLCGALILGIGWPRQLHETWHEAHS